MNDQTRRGRRIAQEPSTINGNILVLGGSGFLGPELIDKLVREFPECPITTFNRGNQNHRINYAIRHIQGDRRNHEDLLQLKRGGFNYIFDLSGMFSETIPTLLDVLGNTVRKYVFISSIAVYQNQSGLMDENSPLGFSAVWGNYGRQKSACEEKLSQCWQGSGDLVILRPAYIFGFKDQNYRENMVLHLMKEGTPIYISNKGQERIQFVHKEDLISICCQMVTKTSSTTVDIYNLASDQVFTVNTWFQQLSKPNSLEPKLKYVPFSEDNRRLFPYLPADVVVCSKKVETALNRKLSNDFSIIQKGG